jgi:hypothetical protein
MRAWALSRIEECRRQELKFGSLYNLRYCVPGGTKRPGKYPPQTLVEAWSERRALQAVLAQLDEGARQSEEGDDG